MKKKRYLVTGGTGFIGSSLVRRLVKEGNFVRVLDNDIRGAQDRLSDIKGKIEIVKADIRVYDEVKAACNEIDSVIHLAYINGTEYFYKMPELVLEVAVKGMMNILDSCIKENIKEFILASSSEVYQSPKEIPTSEDVPLIVPDVMNPRFSYGGGKIICELLAINYSRKHFDRMMIFRPHNVYGPDMGWEHVLPQFVLRMKEISSKEKGKKIRFPIQGDGSETRSFVFIDDFIDGIMIMLKKGKHMNIYHIGTMDEISIKDAAVSIGNYFKKRVEIVKGKDAKGGTKRRCPNISKLSALGYKPKVSFIKGAEITTRWYDENSSKIRKIK